ncbi:MAG TPA: dihydrofolate reductase family protein [Pseudomonadales bacterium]|nr:dihydrofolate reductase family protein [Pseudomonadales bacterium]
MRRLVVPTFISLDGVVQAPGGAEEDTSGGFRYGGWIVPFADGAEEAMGGVFSRPFELLLGRRTYDIFAAYWPRVTKGSWNQGIADLFNGAVKHVATHHPATLEWQNSHALGPNTAAGVRELKRADGPDLLTQGSSDLVRQLLATDLVDELRLLIYPVLLGRGKRLFDDDTLPSGFRLAESRATRSGVLITRYVRDGEVRTGAFKEGT